MIDFCGKHLLVFRILSVLLDTKPTSGIFFLFCWWRYSWRCTWWQQIVGCHSLSCTAELSRESKVSEFFTKLRICRRIRTKCRDNRSNNILSVLVKSFVALSMKFRHIFKQKQVRNLYRKCISYRTRLMFYALDQTIMTLHVWVG